MYWLMSIIPWANIDAPPSQLSRHTRIKRATGALLGPELADGTPRRVSPFRDPLRALERVTLPLPDQAMSIWGVSDKGHSTTP